MGNHQKISPDLSWADDVSDFYWMIPPMYLLLLFVYGYEDPSNLFRPSRWLNHMNGLFPCRQDIAIDHNGLTTVYRLQMTIFNLIVIFPALSWEDNN